MIKDIKSLMDHKYWILCCTTRKIKQYYKWKSPFSNFNCKWPKTNILKNIHLLLLPSLCGYWRARGYYFRLTQQFYYFTTADSSASITYLMPEAQLLDFRLPVQGAVLRTSYKAEKQNYAGRTKHNKIVVNKKPPKYSYCIMRFKLLNY